MTSNPSRRRCAWSAAVSAMLMFLSSGCGYPQVGEQAMELAKAVDNLCNLREASQIEQAREIIQAERTNGTITDAEQTYLLAILDTAADGDWEAAQQESRRLLVDQQRW